MDAAIFMAQKIDSAPELLPPRTLKGKADSDGEALEPMATETLATDWPRRAERSRSAAMERAAERQRSRARGGRPE